MIYNLKNKLHSLIYYSSIYWVYKVIFSAIGAKTRIKYPLKIRGYKNICLGSNINIGKMIWLESDDRFGKGEGKIVIKDGSYLGNFCHIYSTGSILVENKVLIADKVYIADNSHNYDNPNKPILDQGVKQLPFVIIGENSWIGENTCIIGAKIGRNCVVGANSFVNKDVPDYSIVAGTPAKVIKRYDFSSQKWLKTDKNGNFIN